MKKEIVKAKDEALDTVMRSVRAIFSDTTMPEFE